MSQNNFKLFIGVDKKRFSFTVIDTKNEEDPNKLLEVGDGTDDTCLQITNRNADVSNKTIRIRFSKNTNNHYT